MLRIGRTFFFLVFCDTLLLDGLKGVSMGVAGGLIDYEH
jgi:hypothetical protein